MKQPVWNVYYNRMPQNKIVVYNVLSHGGVKKDIVNATKKVKTKAEFGEELRRSLMYYFWSRSEYEILVRAWCGGNGDEEIKIDIYDQIKCNWNVFLDYVWKEKKKFDCEQK